MKRVIFVLIVSMLLAMPLVGQAKKQTRSTSDYFPLGAHYRWIYKVTDEHIIAGKTTDASKGEGKAKSVIDTLYFRNDTLFFLQAYIEDWPNEETMKLRKLGYRNLTEFSDPSVWSYLDITAKLVPLRIHKPWWQERDSGTSGGAIEGIERIEVQGRVFDSCIHIVHYTCFAKVMNKKWPMSMDGLFPTAEHHLWYAKGIGLVKEVFIAYRRPLEMVRRTRELITCDFGHK